MQRIFLDQNGRLRSGWRALLFAFSLIFAVVVIVVVATVLLGEEGAANLPLVVKYGTPLVPSILVGWLYLRLLEGLPIKALGVSFTEGWLKHFSVGMLLGGLGFVSGVIITVMGGGFEFRFDRESAPSSIYSTLITTIFLFLIAAASEEAIFRGYLLQTLVRGPIKWFAVVLTALLFSYGHGANPGESPLSTLNTALAGVWFGVAYLKTRDLWFPFGIHFMWNWLQGPIFGINVSGISSFSPDPVFRATDHGPAWLTGGAYGLEGGIACTIAIVISIGLIYFLPILKPSEEMLDLSEARLPSGS